jgi:hypothetical protein
MDMQTVVVEYPSGLPDHVRAAQEATRRKDQMTDEQETAQQSSSRFTSRSLSGAVDESRMRLNEVVAQQGAARFTGYDDMRMPAPLMSTPMRSSNTPWTLVFSDYMRRFYPYVEDMEILVKRYNIRLKRELETLANVSYRSRIPYVWGGKLPTSESVAAEEMGTRVAFLCGHEEDRELRQYVREFRTVAGELQRLQEPWLG